MKPGKIYNTIIASIWGAMLLMIPNTSRVWAAGPAVQNKISFTESWTDKPVCSYDKDGKAWSCYVASPGSMTISATITGIFSAATTNTPFNITLGNFTGEFILGDDLKFKPGKSTTATFFLTTENDNGKTVILNTIKLTWTANKLTVTSTGKGDSAGGYSIGWEKYDGTGNGKTNDTISGEILFGTTDVIFTNVALTGTLKTKFDVPTKDGSSNNLSTVSLKGSGTAP